MYINRSVESYIYATFCSFPCSDSCSSEKILNLNNIGYTARETNIANIYLPLLTRCAAMVPEFKNSFPKGIFKISSSAKNTIAPPTSLIMLEIGFLVDSKFTNFFSKGIESHRPKSIPYALKKSLVLQ